MKHKSNERSRSRTIISFHGDRVVIQTPTSNLHTTRDTMERLGVCGDLELDNVQEFTVRQVLEHARTNRPLSCPIRAHALYHGLIPLSAEETMVRLDVGGCGFQFPRAFLMDHFMYFRAMFTGLFREARDENDTIFIDRSPELFQSVLSVAVSGDTKYMGVGVSEELLFYGYVEKPKQEEEKEKPRGTPTAQDLRDAHNAAISFDSVWKLISRSLEERMGSIRMGYSKNDGTLRYHFSNRTTPETRDRILAELRDRGFTAEMNEAENRMFPCLTLTW